MHKNLAQSFKHQHMIENTNTNWEAMLWEREFDHDSLDCVAFSPDGRSIACGSFEGNLYILNVRTGAAEGGSQGHSELERVPVQAIAYSPDGRFIASILGDHNVCIWSAQTGNMVTGLQWRGAGVTSVSYSPDGQKLVLGSWDGTICFWDVQTGTQVGEPLHVGSRAYAIAYNPHDCLIAAGSEDGTVRLWDAQSRVTIGKPMQGHSGQVISIAFSPDMCRIASGSDDGTVRIWDTNTGDAMGEPFGGYHSFGMTSVSYSPDGCFIAFGSHNGTISICDTQTHEEVSRLQGHSGKVKHVAYSTDGCYIASVSTFGDIVRVWDVQIHAGLRNSTHESTSAAINAVAVSPGSQLIAAGSNDCLVHIWDLQTGATVGKPFQGHTDRVRSVAFSPDGSFIVSGSDDGTIRLWDARTGATVRGPLNCSGAVHSVAYSPDGDCVAFVSLQDDFTTWSACIWNLMMGDIVYVPRCDRELLIWSMTYSPNGNLLVSTINGSKWDPQWEINPPVHWAPPVSSSPDGLHVVPDDSRTLRIWNTQTQTAVGKPLVGDLNDFQCVACSPDGHFIVSGDDDGNIHTWDAQTGTAVSQFRGHNDMVNSVAYSPDGRLIVSSSNDSRVCVYDAPTRNSFPPGDLDQQQIWTAYCRGIEGGWIKHDGCLLLWVPPAHREDFHYYPSAHIVINGTSSVGGLSVDYKRLLTYSGKNWTMIYSEDPAERAQLSQK